jgi:endo-1,4-beta-D-glucanase Y
MTRCPGALLVTLAALLTACAAGTGARPDAGPAADAEIIPDGGGPDGTNPDGPIGSGDAAAPDGSPGPEAGTADGPIGGLGHPFGTHGGYYGTGVLFPSDHTPAELDDATASFYDGWKSRYLKPACQAGQYLMKSSPSTSAWTVSEAHGYGMVTTVVMAGHDPEARSIFDGLYAYYDGHRSTVDSNLMAWAQDSSCQDVEGSDSATDGDLDIAYSLLLADAQWGSGGTIDYLAEGKRIIAAILASDVHPENSLLIGDWATSGDAHYNGTRPSDFMTDHFKVFQRMTGVARWNDVVDKTYAVVTYLQQNHSPSTGLLPDFAINAPTPTPQPAPSGWLEGADDGNYSWNACRTPWRLAIDYLMSGEVRSQTAVRKMNAWIRTKTGDSPASIWDGYQLDGTTIGTGAQMAFMAPFGVSAMVEAASGTNQAWLNALWDAMVGQGPGEYYGDSLKLQAMIVMSGNWWAP